MLMTQDRLLLPAADTSSPERVRPAGLLDLRGFWMLLRRRLRLISGVAAAIMIMVVAVLFLMTPRYTASNVLIVDPRQQRVLQSEAVLAGIGADAAAVESQVEVIQSTTLAHSVIDRLGLAEDPEFTRPSLMERVAALVVDKVVPPDVQAQRVLAKFAANLKVQRRGLTYVLEISFTPRKPRMPHGSPMRSRQPT